jgi:hypothetical protein
MFLTELLDELRNAQTKHGNVPLDFVHVVAGTTLAIAHGTQEDISGGKTDLPDPDLEKLLALSLEDRLKLCSLGGIVAVTGEELVQLLEFKAEAIAADANKKPPEGTAPTLRVEHDVEAQGKAAEAAGEPLAKVSEDAAQRAAGE